MDFHRNGNLFGPYQTKLSLIVGHQCNRKQDTKKNISRWRADTRRLQDYFTVFSTYHKDSMFMVATLNM